MYRRRDDALACSWYPNLRHLLLHPTLTFAEHANNAWPPQEVKKSCGLVRVFASNPAIFYLASYGGLGQVECPITGEEFVAPVSILKGRSFAAT